MGLWLQGDIWRPGSEYSVSRFIRLVRPLFHLHGHWKLKRRGLYFRLQWVAVGGRRRRSVHDDDDDGWNNALHSQVLQSALSREIAEKSLARGSYNTRRRARGLTAIIANISLTTLKVSFVLPVTSGSVERRKNASSKIFAIVRIRPESRTKWRMMR